MAAANVAPNSVLETNTSDREFVATRDFDASADVVFDLWTDAQHITQWWGPNGFRTTTNRMDVRPDGEWRFTMHGPDGTDYANCIVYIEVVPTEKLVYDHHAGDRNIPPHFRGTVTFTPVGKKTRVTLRGVFPSAAEFEHVRPYALSGANQTLERFGKQLDKKVTVGQGLPALSINRVFDAPRELVFEAFIHPEHAKHWMGPRGFTATHFEQDARPGGRWRACLHQTGEWKGQQYPDLWQGGVFHEIVPPERIVYTFAWEGQGGQPTRETLITVVFSELADDQTRMDFHQEFFDSVGQRDGHNEGWNSSFDRLNDFIQAMTNESKGN